MEIESGCGGLWGGFGWVGGGLGDRRGLGGLGLDGVGLRLGGLGGVGVGEGGGVFRYDAESTVTKRGVEKLSWLVIVSFKFLSSRPFRSGLLGLVLLCHYAVVAALVILRTVNEHHRLGLCDARVGVRRARTAILAACTGGSAAPLPPPVLTSAPVKHVFTIILENQAYNNTFGPQMPTPYLSQTVAAQGALLQNYYGTSHFSLGNYISLISGQAVTTANQDDCTNFGGGLGSNYININVQQARAVQPSAPASAASIRRPR